MFHKKPPRQNLFHSWLKSHETKGKSETKEQLCNCFDYSFSLLPVEQRRYETESEGLWWGGGGGAGGVGAGGGATSPYGTVCWLVTIRAIRRGVGGQQKRGVGGSYLCQEKQLGMIQLLLAAGAVLLRRS